MDSIDAIIYIYDSVVADPISDATVYIYDSVIVDPTPDATVYVYDNVIETIYPANISLISSIETTPSQGTNISLLPYIGFDDYDSTIYLYFDTQYEPTKVDSDIYLYADTQYEQPIDTDSSIYLYGKDIDIAEINNITVTFF